LCCDDRSYSLSQYGEFREHLLFHIVRGSVWVDFNLHFTYYLNRFVSSIFPFSLKTGRNLLNFLYVFSSFLHSDLISCTRTHHRGIDQCIKMNTIHSPCPQEKLKILKLMKSRLAYTLIFNTSLSTFHGNLNSS